MKSVNKAKTAAVLFVALFAAMPAFGVKYVAVVESEVDAASGVSADMTSAEVRLVTSEIRRAAVKNLPLDRYNVMTTETVYAQGSATLEACSEENCVIKLGSMIGADYIVRGTVSKTRAAFTLSVEIYETADGTLVASSDPVRSENVGEIFEKAAINCGEMFKTFAVEQGRRAASVPVQIFTDTEPSRVEPAQVEPAQAEPARVELFSSRPAPVLKEKPAQRVSVGGGAFLAGSVLGGLAWESGAQVAMPYYGGGAFLYVDLIYVEIFAGYQAGGGMWESADVLPPYVLPDMKRSYVNIGLAVKPAIAIGNVMPFPLIGFDYETGVSGKLIADGYETELDAGALSAIWLKFGFGIDFDLGQTLYMRAELLGGARFANGFEKNESISENAEARPSVGAAFKIGVGIKL
jgi:hypothetical protein